MYNADLDEIVTVQTFFDCDYLSWFISEILRIQPPINGTAYLNLSQDTKVGDLTIRKGDEFMIDIQALHMNARVWPKPFEFIP